MVIFRRTHHAPRAGTFIYHTYCNDETAIKNRLYGVLYSLRRRPS
jgi:hypothetical protein